jgi:hypothetical protein
LSQSPQQSLRRLTSAIEVSSPSSVEFISIVNLNLPQDEVLALCQMKLSIADGGRGVKDELRLEYRGCDSEIFK